MTAWTGLIVGGVVGGILGAVLTKMAFKHVDIGVTAASAGALALVGGAMTAATPQPQASAAPVS